jgi:hypothetical protein
VCEKEPRGHVRLIAVDPADNVPVKVSVQPKYVDTKPPPRRNLEPPPRKNRDPAPPLFDIAKDNSVFRLLDPTTPTILATIRTRGP